MGDTVPALQIGTRSATGSHSCQKPPGSVTQQTCALLSLFLLSGSLALGTGRLVCWRLRPVLAGHVVDPAHLRGDCKSNACEQAGDNEYPDMRYVTGDGQCSSNPQGSPSLVSFPDRAAGEYLAHSRLLKGALLPILAYQRKGVVCSRKEAALNPPEFPRRGLVLVEKHRGSGSRFYYLYLRPVKPGLPRCRRHHRPCHGAGRSAALVPFSRRRSIISMPLRRLPSYYDASMRKTVIRLSRKNDMKPGRAQHLVLFCIPDPFPAR